MKKCLFIYGDHDISHLFDSHPSKINFHGQWIALKNLLYKQGIELISKKNIGINKPDLEIHLNVWSTNDPWPKFAILNETKYIHPDNFNLKLLKNTPRFFLG